ncbi:MAG TPA: beta-ketoacyl synthase N-terminal-like domain-containing protein [Ktedonobacteraceae bacterium]
MNNADTFDHEIAIVGMVGRFPGARNIDEYWRNVCAGVESIAFFSDQEALAAGIDPGLLNNPAYVKAYGVLDDIDLFDATFFGYSPREAQTQDPQHRLFLECAWEALENAGYDAEQYKGRVGVYAGASPNSYLRLLATNPDLVAAMGTHQILIGNDKDYLATRVSYKLNLKGPSMTIQTACSTSLVAIHLACQSLLSGESDMCLAGGVSISVPQKAGYLYLEGSIRSPDGHCRAFDARAQGTVSGSGVAVVVLKRLADAIADGDCIHAVIKGSAINNDGAMKIGYTAPGIDGQSEVITEALAVAEVDPETIFYIETHGTGTVLGDPIEVAALTRAFGSRTEKKGYCALGSVKTNIGHLDAAAGVAGLIKAALVLKYGLLPPSLHFEEPNPGINFAQSPFYVNSKLSAWKASAFPHRAGVSSFGIGGTNAHAVLEEAPRIQPAERAGSARSWQLLVLSARTGSALEAATRNLLAHLKQHSELRLADVAHTLQSGRQAFEHRRMVVCQSLDDAVTALEKAHHLRVFSSIQEHRDLPVVFMFPGGGAQRARMGFELYQHEPVFRAQVDSCAELLKTHLGFDLRTVLYPDQEQVESATERLQEPSTNLAALFTTEYALAKLWMAWGIRPQAMIGHSLGEYVAACLAGVFSLPDALALVTFRGRLFEELPAGMMLSVLLPAEEVLSLLPPTLDLAAINSPSLCVISGPAGAIGEMEKELTARGIEARQIPIKSAAHSKMLLPVLDKFTRFIKGFRMQAPRLPYISNVTGTWITVREATSPDYWTTHLRQTVRFAAGVHTLLQKPDTLLLEVGAEHTLSMLARHQADPTSRQRAFPSFDLTREQPSEMAALLTTMGRLWLAGVRPDWSGFSAYEKPQRIPLPTYPFEHQRYWIEASKKARALSPLEEEARPDKESGFYISSWKRSTLPDLAGLDEYPDRAESWLVFVDAYGLGARIVQRLQARGQEVITVTAGPQFAQRSPGNYTLDPRAPGDYAALIAELDQGKWPARMIHLWHITPDVRPPAGQEFAEMGEYQGFSGWLLLAQAYGIRQKPQALDITLVFNGIQDITGTEALHVQKAALLGPCKMLPLEYSEVSCRAIDVVLPAPGTWQEEKLIDDLLAEAGARSAEQAIAYRGKHRWVQTFERGFLHAPLEGGLRLRDKGVYLFIDSPQDHGMLLKACQAHVPRARFVVVEPPDFPPRAAWEQWLATQREQNRVNQKIQLLQEFAASGTEILVLSANTSNQEHMHAVISQVHERFGALHGVISTAGYSEETLQSPIQNMDPATYELYLQSKMAELRVLEQALQAQKLDFCMLCSSLPALSGARKSAIEATMAFLSDAFVSQHNRRTAISWLSAHRDLGARSADQEQPAALASLVSSLEAYPSLSRPDLHTVYVAPRNQMEQTIAVLWQELLGLNQIGIHDTFFELGGHSLMAARLMTRLRDLFLVDIPLKSLFERPTIEGLAEVIEELFVEKLEQLSEEEAEQLMSNVFNSTTK